MKDWLYNLKRAVLMLEAVKLNPRIYELWDINESWILDSKPKYEDYPHVGRFAYNPKTGELVLGTLKNMHAIDIGWQSNSPFDDFVRGVYTGDEIMLRWYSPDPYATSEEIMEASFNAFYDTELMLECNGKPSNVTVRRGVGTEDIQQEVGRFFK